MYIPKVIGADEELAIDVAAYVFLSQGTYLPPILADELASADVTMVIFRLNALQAVHDLEILCNARKKLHELNSGELFSL